MSFSRLKLIEPIQSPPAGVLWQYCSHWCHTMRHKAPPRGSQISFIYFIIERTMGGDFSHKTYILFVVSDSTSIPQIPLICEHVSLYIVCLIHGKFEMAAWSPQGRNCNAWASWFDWNSTALLQQGQEGLSCIVLGNVVIQRAPWGKRAFVPLLQWMPQSW